MIKTIFFIIIFIQYTSTFYLSNFQYITLMKIIREDNLSLCDRKKINTILYKSHETYCIKKSLTFKKKHFFKCSKISNDEIIWYGKMGLYKAVNKYNGNTNFTYYANLNIHFELMNALSDAYSLSILPDRIRRKNKKDFTQDEIYKYNKLLNVNLYQDTIYWKRNEDSENIIDNQYSNYKYQELWNYIHTLEPYLKDIILIKYDNNFNVIRTNKLVANMTSYSTETIRKRLIEFKIIMKQYFENFD